MRGDETNVDVDPALIPLQAQQAQQFPAQPFAAVPGQLRSIAGQTGPDINVATAAPSNGVAVTHTPATNTLTFGLSGIGTMAQRNAIAAVADLNQTIGAVPTQAEVQAISDKIDELLAAMRTASHLIP